jgi:hypothetical protein
MLANVVFNFRIKSLYVDVFGLYVTLPRSLFGQTKIIKLEFYDLNDLNILED